MNSFRFFLVLAISVAGGARVHAEVVGPDATYRPALPMAACAVTEADPTSRRAEALVSYALLHAGSGLAMFGFPFSGVAEGGAAKASGTSLRRDTVANALGRVVAATCCAGGADTQDGGRCGGRIRLPEGDIDIVDMLENVAARDATVSILRTFDGDALRLETPQGARLFAIPALYVTGDILRHRDQVSDTELGRIVAVAR